MQSERYLSPRILFAALHIVGTIEPGALIMRSVYFATDRPRTLKAKAGLLPSEQDELKTIAEEFKKYLAFKSDARLILAGHADRRGPESYNMRLSERRTDIYCARSSALRRFFESHAKRRPLTVKSCSGLFFSKSASRFPR
jgi:hypothetical protein